MKGTAKIWIYEDFRLDDSAGARCFVALEWSQKEKVALDHLRRNSEDGAIIAQEQDDFFGNCYVARDAEKNLLGRVRTVEAV